MPNKTSLQKSNSIMREIFPKAGQIINDLILAQIAYLNSDKNVNAKEIEKVSKTLNYLENVVSPIISQAANNGEYSIQLKIDPDIAIYVTNQLKSTYFYNVSLISPTESIYKISWEDVYIYDDYIIDNSNKFIKACAIDAKLDEDSGQAYIEVPNIQYILDADKDNIKMIFDGSFSTSAINWQISSNIANGIIVGQGPGQLRTVLIGFKEKIPYTFCTSATKINDVELGDLVSSNDRNGNTVYNTIEKEVKSLQYPITFTLDDKLKLISNFNTTVTVEQNGKVNYISSKAIRANTSDNTISILKNYVNLKLNDVLVIKYPIYKDPIYSLPANISTVANFGTTYYKRRHFIKGIEVSY